MTKLHVGTKVNIFDREGCESDTGNIVGIVGTTFIIRCGKKEYRIPSPSIEISLNARGNTLDKYLTNADKAFLSTEEVLEKMKDGWFLVYPMGDMFRDLFLYKPRNTATPAVTQATYRSLSDQVKSKGVDTGSIAVYRKGWDFNYTYYSFVLKDK